DDYLSFYSNHTSTVFAAGISYARTYQLRHPNSPTTPWLYAGTVVVGGVIGSLRVFSGRHFPSDVLVGALVGSAIGWMVPTLHKADGLGVTLIPWGTMGVAAVLNFP